MHKSILVNVNDLSRTIKFTKLYCTQRTIEKEVDEASMREKASFVCENESGPF